MDLKSSYPFWVVKNGLMHAFPRLRQDVRCDVTVIEQRDLGWGSSSASKALLQRIVPPAPVSDAQA